MRELNMQEVDQVDGGNVAVAAAAGALVGVATGALVIGTGGIALGVLAGIAIWGGADAVLEH